MHNSHSCSYCRRLGSYMSVHLFVCLAGETRLQQHPYPHDGGIMLYVADNRGYELVSDEPYIVDTSSPIGLVEAKIRAMEQGWIISDRANAQHDTDAAGVGDALARLR